jgi:hypothetical protein
MKHESYHPGCNCWKITEEIEVHFPFATTIDTLGNLCMNNFSQLVVPPHYIDKLQVSFYNTNNLLSDVLYVAVKCSTQFQQQVLHHVLQA